MNIAFPYLPVRPAKPREEGLTMMMDKGLSLAEAENFVSSGALFTDLVKFGFGTAIFTPSLKEKISLYKSAGLRPYFGGTLFEAFVIRGMFDTYRKMLDDFGLETAEVSDGSMKIAHDQKMAYIRCLSGQVTVLSEVGSKVAGVEIPNEEWVKQMQTELSAGAWKVIAEARESGT
ncbi:MAG: phosphosulfolactate synthase, partial [Bacteroidales bacterium]